MHNELINNVTKHLEKNKIDRALKEFKHILKLSEYKDEDDIKDIYTTYIKISSRFNTLKDNELSDTIAIEDARIEQRKIVDKLVDMCSELEDVIETINKSNKTIEEIIITPKKLRVPVIPLYAAAGSGGDGSQSISEKDIIDYLLISEYDKNKQYIAVPVVGNSMSPTIEYGDTLICYKILPNEIQNEKVYLISEKNNETVVKRIYIESIKKQYTLKSDNPKYADKHVNEEDCTFWKVHKIMRDCK